MTHCIVVDTGVFAVAARMHDPASEECVLACVQILRRVHAGQRIAVDTADTILTEYLGTLRSCPEPGLASKLAERVFRTRYSNDTCHRVDITPLDNPPGSFAEVPPPVRDFDVDDQKFLAVAVAEGNTPPIFAALDEEWWRRRADLTAVGIDVQFPCAADLI